jgi:hypothetical protein
VSSLGDDFSEYNAGSGKRVVDYFAANSLGISIHECEAKFSRFCIFVRRQNATSGVSVHQLEELRLPVNNILRKIGLG